MEKINGIIFKGMLESGCNNLNGNKKEVDALNVFPVPDGDTGTNMSLTFTNGVSEVKKSGSDSLPTIAKTLSRGLLMGARGNSGVILSQIFRGIYQYIGEKTELSSKEFSEALLNGSKLAYKAVMRPTEGTILTVIREASAKGEEFINANPEASIEEFMNAVLDEANASLERTPELLPVLKEAHVVDSGGAGLVKVLEGFKAFLDGNPVTEETVNEEKKETKKSRLCLLPDNYLSSVVLGSYIREVTLLSCAACLAQSQRRLPLSLFMTHANYNLYSFRDSANGRFLFSQFAPATCSPPLGGSDESSAVRFTPAGK